MIGKRQSIWRLTAIFAIFWVAFTGVGASQETIERSNLVDQFDLVTPAGVFYADGRVNEPLINGSIDQEVWSFGMTFYGKKGVSVGIEFVSLGDGPWHIAVTSGGTAEELEIIDAITTKEAALLSGNAWWSRPAQGGTLWVRVYGSARGLTIRTIGYTVSDEVYGTERPVGVSQLKAFGFPDAAELDPLLDVKDAVVLLVFTMKDGKRYPCTGFKVSYRWVLTARHCLKRDVTSIRAEFFYEFQKTPVAVPVAIPIKESKLMSRDLDYMLLKLLAPDRVASVAPLRIAPLLVSEKRELSSIQHPVAPQSFGPSVKHGTVKDCHMAAEQTFPGWFYHHCDTFRGSSGAPILFDGRVVGMHLSAWKSDAEVRLNFGVKISQVLAHVCRADTSIIAELDVEEGERWVESAGCS